MIPQSALRGITITTATVAQSKVGGLVSDHHDPSPKGRMDPSRTRINSPSDSQVRNCEIAVCFVIPTAAPNKLGPAALQGCSCHTPQYYIPLHYIGSGASQYLVWASCRLLYETSRISLLLDTLLLSLIGVVNDSTRVDDNANETNRSSHFCEVS